MTLGPVAIRINGTNLGSGTLSDTLTGLTVPPFTSYVVTVTGMVDVMSNPAAACNPVLKMPYGSEGSYGPAGTGTGELRIGATGFGVIQDGGTRAQEARTDTLFASDSAVQIHVWRSGLSAETGGGPCPQTGLYLLKSSQKIFVTLLDGQELQINPKAVSVRRGTVVSFTATSGGSPVDAPNWRFVPSDTGASQTSDCGMAGPNPCSVTVRSNGQLRVSKMLQGRNRSDGASIRVYSSFTLKADKQEIPAGDTVTFTPYLDGIPGVAARWVWRGDSTQILDPCPSTASDKCSYAPAQSGTMWAFTTSGDSAQARVVVVPCPIRDDSLLNRAAVRNGLKALIDSSRTPPVTDWKEHVARIWRDTVTGVVYMADYTRLTTSTSCSVTPGGPDDLPPPTPNSVWLADAHSHPFARNEQIPVNTCPKLKRDEVGFGENGPSSGDDSVATMHGHPQYIIDKNRIYRTDGYENGNYRGKPIHKEWRRNQNGCTDVLPSQPLQIRVPYVTPLMLRSRSSHASPVAHP